MRKTLIMLVLLAFILGGGEYLRRNTPAPVPKKVDSPTIEYSEKRPPSPISNATEEEARALYLDAKSQLQDPSCLKRPMLMQIVEDYEASHPIHSER